MISKYHNIMKLGLLGAAVLLGATACTDDHFDVVTDNVTGQNTVWQNVKATADLDSVALILQRTKVMKNETDGGNKQTYAQLLDQPQEFTAWLPKNGTFVAQTYIDLLDRADRLSQTGVLSDSIESLKIHYQVGNQFARNHVARFNYGSNLGAQQVRMLNGKVLTYNAAEGKFNGIAVDAAQANIHSSNGTLHVIDAKSPYAYNVYDYMVYDSRFSKLFADIDAYNIYEFNANASTQGAMNENGQMVYVDSVFTRSNEIMMGAGLFNIENEDSVYIALLPTDEVYDAAKEKMSKYFKFANSYNYEWNKSSNDFNNKNANAYKPNADSLQRVNTLGAILSMSTISAANVNAAAMYDQQKLLNAAIFADSLRFTSGSYIMNPNAKTTTPNPIFEAQADAAQGATNAEKASNGYVFPLRAYNFEPENFGGKSMTEAYSPSTLCTLTGSQYTVDQVLPTLLSVDNLNDTIDLGGYLPDDYYTYFPISGNNTLRIDFRLRGIMSNFPYKISIIMLPNCTDISHVRTDAQGNPIDENPIFDAYLLDDKGATLSQVRQVPVNQKKVEKVTLFDNYEFKYNYQNLPSEYDSFPRLSLRMSYAYQNRGKSKALSIGRLIIEPASGTSAESK